MSEENGVDVRQALLDEWDALKRTIEMLETDMRKNLLLNNASAGRRARKLLQQVKTSAQTLRMGTIKLEKLRKSMEAEQTEQEEG